MRVAAATSALMIGVTAVSGGVIYLGRGALIYELAAAAIIGTQIGSAAGSAAVGSNPHEKAEDDAVGGADCRCAADADQGFVAMHPVLTRTGHRHRPSRRYARGHRRAGDRLHPVADAGAAAVLAHAMLAAGIGVLLFTPVARVLVSLVDFILGRDWLFVVLNTIVLLLVGSAFIAAFR
jgi:hypothetical protein